MTAADRIAELRALVLASGIEPAAAADLGRLSIESHMRSMGLEPAPPPPDFATIAAEAIALLLSVGCYGLDASKQRELWQRGLDLSHRMHPDEPRYVVWTPEEGDIDPAREEGSPS
jgi:hypothetical protein